MASKRRLQQHSNNYYDSRHQPFSSDECPNSAEESDEDIITDYLAPPSPSNQVSGGLLMAHQQTGGPLVPIISVTPHSPGSRHYPILEENLQQLHDIHESIQKMREHSAQAFNHQMLRLNQYTRLSASCPSLNNSEPDMLAASNTSSPTQIHGSACSSAHTTPQASAHPGFKAKDLLISREDPRRRRSWTALGDNHEKRKSDRQRSSMSLSSMDSDQDDPFSEGAVFLATNDGGKKQRRYSGTTSPVSCATWTSGGASTHSLNEADLQNDFNKIVAKREGENLRLLPVRLPLQKSVSTPSIIAVRDIADDVIGASIPVVVETAQHNTLQKFIEGTTIRPSEESETEEDVDHGIIIHPQKNNARSFDDFLTENTTYDASEGKRRKRGSIFFRKKKDKTKKVVTHQWVALSCSAPQVCDYCTKSLMNKPASYCETCTVTVHQSSCKDHIECNKKTIKSNIGKSLGIQSVKQQGKRGSGQFNSHQTSRRNTCYSQWRRVATKLGVNQILSEDRDAVNNHHHQHHPGHHENISDEVPLMTMEFLDDGHITAHELETDPFLGLHEKEPDSWTPTVTKEVTKNLKEKEIKRQEHIYEFILTEKHHCLTLCVMQKIFVEGLRKHFQMGHNLDRMFPRLTDLTEIHFSFLHKLREKQKSRGPVLESIADILLYQFSGIEAEKLKSAYGEFCSRHKDAVDLYKEYLQHDTRFVEFVRHCQTNPLLKKKGIPECVLFVTQRLTKYPLLIEPLIKTSKDNKPEQEKLTRALALVKEILVDVDAQVAEKQKEDRKLEIYNKIEAKSFTSYRNHKFKKSDILSNNRRLRFEGIATLMQGRSKMQEVLVIVLSDVLFFLVENNNKYSFFTPDNKTGVVSLQKLLVREKAGQESRGIYLISSNPNEPEMFELKVQKPKDKQSWISSIRKAVETCPEEEEEKLIVSSEEKKRRYEAKQAQIQQITSLLRQKDIEQAHILEEKMALQLQMLASASGMTNLPAPPSYTHLVADEVDNNSTWKEVLSAFNEVNQLASSLYASGTNLSRSVSSVGEHQSEAYVSPTLPKRAETFGGFDNANKEQLQAFINKALSKKQPSGKDESSTYSTPVGTPESEPNKGGLKLPWKNAIIGSVPSGVLNPSNLGDTVLSELGQEQQVAAVRLSHHVYTLLCIISQQMTTIDRLQANVASLKQQLKEDDGGVRDKRYRHNQQLEELRNLQDKLSHEKEAWARTKENEERDLAEQKAELQKRQDQLRSEQADIAKQREQLYRRMEMLTSQGLLISPNLPVVTTSPGTEEETPSAAATSSPSAATVVAPMSIPSPPAGERRSKWKPSNSNPTAPAPVKQQLPLNLISATNQQKTQTVQIKQQLPLKLAKLGSSSGSNSIGNITGTITKDTVTQLLPMKLMKEKGSSPQMAGTYQRLSSNSFGPTESSPSSITSAASHMRTGSSPAMMQQASTYPRMTSPPTNNDKPTQQQQKNAPRATEEEVIFF